MRIYSFISTDRTIVPLLRYVVEQALAGNATRIKAYTTDALGRDASFDADNDPIVRVAAGRPRRALDAYYLDDGTDEP